MDAIGMIFMLLIVSLISQYEAHSCKAMDFKVTFKGKTLENHVFKTIRATNDGHCESQCFLDDRCISYSYGTSADGKKYMCELSDSDHFMHPEDLVIREGVIYRSAQNTCNCKGNQTCKYDFINHSGTCLCKPGFTGSNCETNINECSSNPCHHGGTCVDEIDGYKCQCLIGTHGIHCEHNIDDCASSPCQHEGSCVDRINDFRCVCPAGYIGKICDQDIDECASNPCQNGATCNDMVNGFNCTCSEDYHYGSRCENIDYCLYRPCQNGGTCTDRTTDGRCTCTSIYQGNHCQYQKYCETHPDACLGGATCRNNDRDWFWCSCGGGEDYRYSNYFKRCKNFD